MKVKLKDGKVKKLGGLLMRFGAEYEVDEKFYKEFENKLDTVKEIKKEGENEHTTGLSRSKTKRGS